MCDVAMIDGPYQQPEWQPHAYPQPQRPPSDHRPEFRTTPRAPETWRTSLGRREMLPIAGVDRAQQDVSLTNVCKLLTPPSSIESIAPSQLECMLLVDGLCALHGAESPGRQHDPTHNSYRNKHPNPLHLKNKTKTHR